MKSFYDKDAKQIHYLDERFYTNDDVNYYPSVTTILNVYPKGVFFEKWLKDVGYNADKIVDEAANQGTRVHDLIESYCNGIEVNWANKDGEAVYTLKEWTMFLHYVEFYEKYSPELECVEGKFVSPKLGFGGTIDQVFIIDGVRYMADNKSSNSLHKSNELQLASYAMMWNEKFPDKKIDKTAIMWVNAKTRGESKGKIQGKGWQLKVFDRPYAESYKLFEHTHEIWKEENPNYYPKNRVYPGVINKQNKYYAKK
jgi:hypothetical protein